MPTAKIKQAMSQIRRKCLVDEVCSVIISKEEKMTELALLLALIFSPLAALSSFLITYAEYRKHFPEDLKKARKLALSFALATLVFFAVIIFLAVIFINKFLPK